MTPSPMPDHTASEKLLELAVGVSWTCELALTQLGNRNAAREVLKMLQRVASRHVDCKPATAQPVETPLIVLVVDANPLTLMVLEHLLRELGHTVLSAANAEQAQRLIDLIDGRIDVLVAGLEPDEAGPTLAERMRRDRPDLCVVFTGKPARALPNEQIIPQPICPAELYDALDQTASEVRTSCVHRADH